MSALADRRVDLLRQRAVRGHVLRRANWSLRLAPRTAWATFALLALVGALGLFSISAGDFPLPVKDVILTLLGWSSGPSEFIIIGLRLPRTLVAILVGMGFGMSGAIFQSLARNPLASPDIIGFNSGASLGAVAAIILFGATGLRVALGAVVGGLLTALLVFALAWQRGINPLRLVLIGIGIGFTAYAGVNFLLTRSDLFDAVSATVWMTGSINARVWTHVWTIAPCMAVLVPAALIFQHGLEQLELGDDAASALGVPINVTKLGISLVGVLLAAVAVAVSGPLAFVAFVAGPIARRLTDSAAPMLIPSALVGAVVVLAADLIGRLAFAPMQLPVGVFTAILGAPYLLWLLATQVRRGAL